MILLTGLGLTAVVVFGIYWLDRFYQRFGLVRVTVTFVIVVAILAAILL